jgi:hypothetical protein
MKINSITRSLIALNPSLILVVIGVATVVTCFPLAHATLESALVRHKRERRKAAD